MIQTVGTDGNETPKKLRTGQAATRAKISPTQIKEYCDLGELACELTPGGHRRISEDSLDAWIARRAAENAKRRAQKAPRPSNKKRGRPLRVIPAPLSPAVPAQEGPDAE